jgi:predicted acetyltransferase
MSFLIEPTAQYKEQIIAAVQEFQSEGRLLDYDVKLLHRNFASYLRRMQNQKDRRRISPDTVPTTDFWLIDGDEVIGRLSLRHELNDFLLKIAGHIGYVIRPSRRCQGYGKEILRLGLEQARAIGLTRVLVTCDENNIGSRKVIESNGGCFENAVVVNGSPVKKLRYWIDVAQ